MGTTSNCCYIPGPERISQQISDLKGWRGKTLSEIRNLILEAEPGIQEEWKWGSAVWSKAGTVCSITPYKHHLQLHFFKGASLKDPHSLLNAGTQGMVNRSIDFRKGVQIDPGPLQQLVREAVTFNQLRELFS